MTKIIVLILCFEVLDYSSIHRTGRNVCDFRGFISWQTASKPTSVDDVFETFSQLGIPLVNCGKPLANKIDKPLFFEL